MAEPSGPPSEGPPPPLPDHDSLPPASTSPPSPPPPFHRPIRAIFNQVDLRAFHKSKTYSDFMGFIRVCNDGVKGLRVSDHYHVSPVVEKVVAMLDDLHGWVSEVPPIQQPMRFGNKAFRQWHARLVERGPAILETILPPGLKHAVPELLPYLTTSFGHETRIDYGTGHETHFVVWLYCLFRLGVFTVQDVPALVLRIFTAYLRVMRRLQTEYMLEPAGSHGVWGLDDYHCLVFLWGSSQLSVQATLHPSAIHSDQVLHQESDDFLYFAAIDFIKELKKGAPFAESSPMLDDISSLPTWTKVNVGMLRLYEAEVLGKLPVIQHLLFGTLFPCTWTPTGRSDAPSGGLSSCSVVPVPGGEATIAPWATSPPPPPPSSQTKIGNISAVSTKAPWAKTDL